MTDGGAPSASRAAPLGTHIYGFNSSFMLRVKAFYDKMGGECPMTLESVRKGFDWTRYSVKEERDG